MVNMAVKKLKISTAGVGLLFAACLVAMAGCAGYSVRINGFLEPGHAPEMLKGVPVHVVEDKEATNPIFAKDIRLKLNRLLKSHGFQVVPYESAQYYLLYSYGTGPGRTVTETMPVYQSGGTATVTRTGPRGNSYSTIQLPGTTTYVPYPATVYDRWLVLKLVDGKDYREGKINDIWIGEVSSPGKSSDTREVMNYLLVAGFEHFGENTEKPVVEDISPDDSRVKALVTRQ
jgi:hypothetical protein